MGGHSSYGKSTGGRHGEKHKGKKKQTEILFYWFCVSSAPDIGQTRPHANTSLQHHCPQDAGGMTYKGTPQCLGCNHRRCGECTVVQYEVDVTDDIEPDGWKK